MQILEKEPARLRAQQAGFRPNRTTEGQAAALSARVHSGFRKGLITMAVLIDHKGAWRAGALHKLMEKGVPMRIVRQCIK